MIAAAQAAVQDFLRIFATNVQNIKRTYAMSLVALNKRHSGSALGVTWALVKPVIFIAALWFAVAVGIRQGANADGIPYILWLLPSMMSWNFISDSLVIGGSAVRSNGHFVTKMVYPIETLAVSEVLSLFFVHLMLMGITIALFVLSGFGLSVYFLQLPYFIMCSLAFTVVMATMLSALTAISTDVLHGVKSATTFLFWLSPVLWSTDSLSGLPLLFVKANPMTYLLDGYRSAFITRQWFFQDIGYTLYFWLLLAALALLASFIFSRLEPEFADVL